MNAPDTPPSPAAPSDAESAEAHRRTEAALRANVRDLLRYLESRLGTSDAPDALGDACVVAWRRAADLPVDPLEARLWLFGIARTTVLNARRGNHRRSDLAHHLHRHALRDRTVSAGADAGLEVRDAVDRLEPDLAELVRLIHWDGFTLAQSARLLGVPASTLSSRYRRAMDLLRAALASADPARSAT